MDYGGKVPGLAGDYAGTPGGPSREQALRSNENWQQGLATGNGSTSMGAEIVHPTPGGVMAAPARGVPSLAETAQGANKINDMTATGNGGAVALTNAPAPSAPTQDSTSGSGQNPPGSGASAINPSSLPSLQQPGGSKDSVTSPVKMGSQHTAWTGWGPAQFPRQEKVAGWEWDKHLSAYVTDTRREFTCSCGDVHPPPPSYKTCKCGKIWNSYAIASGGDLRTAQANLYLAREVPVREGVILASRQPRTASAGTDMYWPTAEEEERDFAEWQRRNHDEGSKDRYGPRQQHYELVAAHHLLAEADSAAYVEQEFSNWLMSQGTSLEALRQQNPRDLQNKLDEFLSQRGGGDDASEIYQHLAFRKGAPFAGYDDFADCESENSDKGDSAAYCGEIRYRTEDKHAGWHNPGSQGNGLNIEVMNGPGWWASVHPNGSWNISREDASVMRSGQAGGPIEAKGQVEDFLRRVKAPGLTAAYTGYDDEAPEPFREQRDRQRSRQRADPRKGLGWEARGMDDSQLDNAVFRSAVNALAGFTDVNPRWHGKTPGGPQGPGVDGLKQVTKYKGMSTPYLREMQRRLMTQQGVQQDQDLLRELSFREIFSALHDLTAPGPTAEADGEKTKRTNPGMAAVEDWHHRDQAGRFQRSDGHPTKSKVA